MSGRHRQLLGALTIGSAILTVAADVSAQSYCDERFPSSCQSYRQPPPIFPFGLFQPPQAAAPPEPVPFRAPARPGTIAPPTDPDFGRPAVDPGVGRQYAALYAPVAGEPYPIPAIRLSDIDPEYLRKSVYFPTSEPAGTIIIDAQNRFLYLVQGGGRAVRYGVGVGRQGFGWSGVATIHDKQEWPDWYPPKEMIAREPDLRRQLSEPRSGPCVLGRPANTRGARAAFMWQGNKDTLYRIHGTFEPWTIGKNVSSGCIRMINQDVIDLYARAPVGAKVVVLSARS